MSKLKEILIVGTALGLGHQLVSLIPTFKPEEVKGLSEADRLALAAAQAKRERRAHKQQLLEARHD